MGLPLNIDLQQIFLHALNFVILTGGLYFLLYSPVKKFMDGRMSYYAEMDKKAKEDLEEARRYNAEAKALFDNAGKEITERRERADEELDRYTADKIKEANEKAEKIISDARASADEKKHEIMENAEKDILLLTKEAASRMIYESTDEAYEAFLKTAEKDL
ncbi:MAG: ATP synthase F0 subunit B [Ruminococcaceae bacterium]|nr:ATP synthase F0 subunit B [Oscillospiraceae bacterium]